MKPVYLDYNATTPMDPVVIERMKSLMDSVFGNPSSSHYYGIEARKVIEGAREQVAQFLGCEPEELLFTSGGTESNNLAIKGIAYSSPGRRGHLITSSVEHPAVHEVFKTLESEGFSVTFLPVDGFGQVSPEDLEKALRPDSILVSIMHANNETGTINPIRDLAAVASRHGVPFHTDAAQTPGKVTVRVDDLGVDLLSLAGHKFYGPKGVGVLFVRKGISLHKLMEGANHERNLRPGTENLLEIAGLGQAAELAGLSLGKDAPYMETLRTRLEEGLRERVPGMVLNGHPTHRLPNTLNVSFPGVPSQTLLSALPELAFSAGAACHSADGQYESAVLTAMSRSHEVIAGAVRLSVGKRTTREEIDKAIALIAGQVDQITSSGPSPDGPLGTGEVRLTTFTHGLGCACKIRPQILEQVLAHLPVLSDPRLRVGTETSDDCAVYDLDGGQCLVQTVDFFTPVVDNPRLFGAIAAVNSLSDIYAMGARPLFALNVVGFPVGRLPIAVLHQILEGAMEVAAEAGITVPGGHTVEDPEPKFGWVVSGLVEASRLWRNSTAQPGDALILTKAIGTGILTTALKRGFFAENQLDELFRGMRLLNRNAAETARDYEVHACTDVTGFGLMGHLLEMSRGAGLEAVVQAGHVPLLDGVVQAARAGMVPGGSQSNMEFVAPHLQWDASISDHVRTILCDAQTSGGLLFAVPANQADQLVTALKRCGHPKASRIGHFQTGAQGTVRVLP